jgi:hypothetical protein
MSIKILILILFIVFIIYYLYNFFNPIKSTEKFTDNTISPINNNLLNVNDKRVHFNDNVDVYEYDNNLKYSNKDNLIIENDHINNIVDNLLSTKTTDFNNIDTECYKSLIDIDKNTMFNELETEINNKYKQFDNGEFFNDIDRPAMSTNILNSTDINNYNVNPIINPNCYSDLLQNTDDNTTIWSQYDKMTTNNFKQFDKLDQLTPNNLASDKWTIGDNKEYGSQFDNYAQVN